MQYRSPRASVFATSLFEALHQFGGAEAAVDLAHRKRGTAFDPAVVDAFLAVILNGGLWASQP
jgi:hypothetical protein